MAKHQLRPFVIYCGDNLKMLEEIQDGRIMRKRYLDEQRGVVMGNVWDDIDHLRAGKAEALGYPTQKPISLLEL